MERVIGCNPQWQKLKSGQNKIRNRGICFLRCDTGYQMLQMGYQQPVLFTNRFCVSNYSETILGPIHTSFCPLYVHPGPFSQTCTGVLCLISRYMHVGFRSESPVYGENVLKSLLAPSERLCIYGWAMFTFPQGSEQLLPRIMSSTGRSHMEA